MPFRLGLFNSTNGTLSAIQLRPQNAQYMQLLPSFAPSVHVAFGGLSSAWLTLRA